MNDAYSPTSMVLGVTGPAGSGKSTVMRVLAALGAQIADADALVRWAYNDGAFQKSIAARFGEDVIDAEGSVRRDALADIVFQDESALDDLEAMVHPAVLNQLIEIIEEFRAEADHAPVLALEIPLLYETGAEAMVDRVLVVHAKGSIRDARLHQRGWDAERIAAVDAAQMPAAEKLARADYVLQNDGSVEEAAAQVESLWDRLLAAPSVPRKEPS